LTAACSVEEKNAAYKARARELWLRCSGCGLVLERARLAAAAGVCEHCGHHHPLGLAGRIAHLFDPGSFVQRDGVLRSLDPLGFGEGGYARAARNLQGEAMIYGTASIEGAPLVAAVMDFSVFGGSLGVAVGETFCRACEACIGQGLPLLAVTASGGARMQEGTPALLQMAKAMVALAGLEEAGTGYVSLLCDPTCGGVTASFATAADVILAEPGALVCFSGPRVVEQTTGMRPREGFSRAEEHLRRGLIDQVVPRDRQRRVLSGLLRFLAGDAPGAGREAGADCARSGTAVDM
jgi:acetyl-CoA carboxylase carboxyl transferase beta subunit